MRCLLVSVPGRANPLLFGMVHVQIKPYHQSLSVEYLRERLVRLLRGGRVSDPRQPDSLNPHVHPADNTGAHTFRDTQWKPHSDLNSGRNTHSDLSSGGDADGDPWHDAHFHPRYYAYRYAGPHPPADPRPHAHAGTHPHTSS